MKEISLLSLSGDKDAEVIEASYSMSRYLDDLLNIDNTYFDGLVTYNRIYTSQLRLCKANFSDTEAPFPHLLVNISDGIVSSKMYDKRDDFWYCKFSILRWSYSSCSIIRGLHTCISTYSECLVMLPTLTHEIQKNTSNKAICITNSLKLFQNSIDATTT